jgi:hypothetical protein
MIKFDAHSASLTYPTNTYPNVETARRLIVLVPAHTDFSAATRRIWEITHATGVHVQLLGLCSAAEESRLRRELATMASLLQDGRACVDTQVVVGSNWMDAVARLYETGDAIACFAEQRTGLLQKPLSQVLESNFKTTVYILSVLAPQKPKPNAISRVSAWLGFLAIIAGFGLMQARVVQLPDGGFQNMLLVLITVPELWLIWVWNGWFG